MNRQHAPLVLADATLVPMGGTADQLTGPVRKGSLRIVDGTIAAVGEVEPEPGDEVVDCRGLTLLPGFVQGHVHFCQTLFRGLADDLALLPWLRERIWPLEAAHDAASTRASAELSIASLLRGGTTTVQVMESVRHAEQSFEVAAETGMTTLLGNCLMDAGEGLPANFATDAAEALRICDALRRAFHGAGRLHYVVSPRFILSCTDDLSRDAAAYADQHGLRIHTHANEHPDEVAVVRAARGEDYILALDAQGLLGPRTGLAHCVHVTPAERERLVERQTAVLHCPTTNLKLGSGIAPIADFCGAGLRVALGADGAACNNRLSALTELRQAALLQALAAGPGAWPAAAALHALTLGGATALGLEDELGSLEVGKRGDVVAVDLDGSADDCPDLEPGGDPVSRITWTAADAQVHSVWVGGVPRVQNGELVDIDTEDLATRARTARDAVLTRAGLRA